MLPQSSGYEGQECPEGDLGYSDQAPLSCLCSKYLTGGNRITRFPDSNRHRASAATVQIQLICNVQAIHPERPQVYVLKCSERICSHSPNLSWYLSNSIIHSQSPEMCPTCFPPPVEWIRIVRITKICSIFVPSKWSKKCLFTFRSSRQLRSWFPGRNLIIPSLKYKNAK